MFSRALTLLPSAETNDRLTLRTVIFEFLGSMFGGFQVRGRAGDGCPTSGQSGSRAAPREQAALEEGEQKPEQKRRHADGGDARVHAIEIEHLASGLDHVAYALTGIQHLCQDHICPTDVIEDPERRENRRERRAKYEPQSMPPGRTQGVSGFE